MGYIPSLSPAKNMASNVSQWLTFEAIFFNDYKGIFFMKHIYGHFKIIRLQCLWFKI